MSSCCVAGCTNRRIKCSKVKFYRIPAATFRQRKQRQLWLNAIGRKDWTEVVIKNARVCSEHFISGEKSDDPRSPDYVPSIFKPASPPKERRERMQLDAINRKQKKKLQRREQAEKSSASTVLLPAECPPDSKKKHSADQILTGQFAVKESAHKEHENDFKPIPDDNEDKATPACDSENCKKRIKSLELECHALRTENMLLKEKMDRRGLNEMNLKNNDKKVYILTGLPAYSVLMAVFSFVAPCLKPVSGLPVFQQYMLALIKLRMNLSFDFLAYYFGIDSMTVSELFKRCISIMYCRLVPCLVIWPDRESLKKYLPYAFRNNNFEKTVGIVDCFEIFIEKPSKFSAGAQYYSAYKSHCRVKYLIAFCPQGSICFISNGWGGRTSDKFITEQRHFLSHLLPGDLVLAERGFNVRETANSYQAEFTAFTSDKTPLDPVAEDNTRCLVSLRMHTEKVIEILSQKYTVLQSPAPIGFTEIDRGNDVTLLDEIVKVCCALTNVSVSGGPFQ